MSSIIRDFWSLSTVLIKNECGGKGTGFLVGNKNKRRIFIVTNKHVISENEKIRHNFTRVTFCFNREREDGVVFDEKVEAELDSDGHDVWREHPDKDVDVMAFDITQLLLELPPLKMKVILDDYLATPEIFDRLDIKIADEIIVLGYPDMFGLKHQNNNFPIIRQGIVASRIGEKLEDWGRNASKTEKRTLRGFLIDGAIIPGSSGSPVILKPTMGRYVKKEYLVEHFPPVLLGIVSEMRYAIVPDGIQDFKSLANLGFVCDSETIRETIELFD